MPDKKERLEPSELVESASAIGGALAGTALTFVAGPWVGSAAGQAVARVLIRVGSEIERLFLAPRQERRISEAYQVAAEEIEARLKAGQSVRPDGFFNQPAPDQDSPADELLEGVLRTAANEWEQRKVPYIGRIFAGLSFDVSVSPSESSYLVKLADRLTYRQVALLAFWDAAQDSNRRYEEAVMGLAIRRNEGSAGFPTATIIAEMDDLSSAGLLGVATIDGRVLPPGTTVAGMEAGASFAGIDLNTVRLTDLGRKLYELMGLEHVPDGDLDEVLSALCGGG